MNELNMPRDGDVESLDLGNAQVHLVAITNENRDYLVNVALSMYLGESCKYCGKVYETIDDLNDTVFAGVHEHGRLACGTCWRDNN